MPCCSSGHSKPRNEMFSLIGYKDLFSRLHHPISIIILPQIDHPLPLELIEGCATSAIGVEDEEGVTLIVLLCGGVCWVGAAGLGFSE